MVKLLLTLCLCVSVANAAVRFDGTSSRAFGYSSSTNLNLTNEITIAVWLIKEAGMAASAEFVAKGRNDNGNKANYHLRDDGANGFEFYWANPDATFHGFKNGGALLVSNVPIHVVITHQFGTTNNSMFWTNGIRSNVRASFGTPQSNGAITNASAITFMGYASGQHARGTLIEAAIWDRRLNAEEILSLARGPMHLQPHLTSPDSTSLRGYWLFNEAPSWQTVSGQAWKDQSAWRVDLTATNSPQSRPSPLAIP